MNKSNGKNLFIFIVDKSCTGVNQCAEPSGIVASQVFHSLLEAVIQKTILIGRTWTARVLRSLHMNKIFTAINIPLYIFLISTTSFVTVLLWRKLPEIHMGLKIHNEIVFRECDSGEIYLVAELTWNNKFSRKFFKIF